MFSQLGSERFLNQDLLIIRSTWSDVLSDHAKPINFGLITRIRPFWSRDQTWLSKINTSIRFEISHVSWCQIMLCVYVHKQNIISNGKYRMAKLVSQYLEWKTTNWNSRMKYFTWKISNEKPPIKFLERKITNEKLKCKKIIQCKIFNEFLLDFKINTLDIRHNCYQFLNYTHSLSLQSSVTYRYGIFPAFLTISTKTIASLDEMRQCLSMYLCDLFRSLFE